MSDRRPSYRPTHKRLVWQQAQELLSSAGHGRGAKFALKSSISRDLVNLKVINLFFSKNLVRIPDLSNATNLGKIYLNRCSKLSELPPSLQHLEKLTHLDFSYCKNIRSLPSLYKAISLTQLDLSGCSNLLSFPEVSLNVTKLWLDGTAIEEVPSSIECLSNLRVFNL
ncbi:disease resistance protein RPS6-like [Gossypium hirsutum]|uniref:Disease resistance protein RPS6-like n=1 Tax=Gossypium hirsutum TaxID=3635 RepID=A0A1U8LQ68_GOSHI|nr:disease resistance protein RPS6-like [Gossypium hirsutum]